MFLFFLIQASDMVLMDLAARDNSSNLNGLTLDLMN